MKKTIQVNGISIRTVNIQVDESSSLEISDNICEFVLYNSLNIQEALHWKEKLSNKISTE